MFLDVRPFWGLRVVGWGSGAGGTTTEGIWGTVFARVAVETAMAFFFAVFFLGGDSRFPASDPGWPVDKLREFPGGFRDFFTRSTWSAYADYLVRIGGRE